MDVSQSVTSSNRKRERGGEETERERFSRSATFIILISCCFLTSLMAMAYIVQCPLFKDGYAANSISQFHEYVTSILLCWLTSSTSER